MLITLPWPPSANTYWRRNGSRYFISPKGMAYRNHVFYECFPYRDSFPKDKRIRIDIHAYPPDKRVRDLDNIFKSLLDSLQHAKVFVNDSQIDALSIQRLHYRKGIVEVFIEHIS